MDHDERQSLILQAAGIIINVAIAAVISVVSLAVAPPLNDRIPYHTSALTGVMWVLELLEGHPECIHCELGVHKHVFLFLISYLQQIGVQHSQNIFLEEQLAIFLYRCVTGLSICHIGERFQRSNDTISK